MATNVDKLTLTIVALRSEIIHRLSDKRINDNDYARHLNDVYIMAETLCNVHSDLKLEIALAGVKKL